jgi:tetratricopeptide (TPR) repeat protein
MELLRNSLETKAINSMNNSVKTKPVSLPLILCFVTFMVFLCTNLSKGQSNQAYEKGMELINQGGASNLLKSIDYFNESFRTDPDFAPAYANLAWVYINLGGNFNLLSPEISWKKAQDNALKALSIDEKSARAYEVLAIIEQEMNWDWVKAEELYWKAHLLEPENIRILMENAHFHRCLGQDDKAAYLVYKASQLQPDHNSIKLYRAIELCEKKKFEEAKEIVRKEIDNNPSNPYYHWHMACILSKEGKCKDAIERLNIQIPLMNGDIADETALLGYNFAVSGMRQEAIGQLTKLDELANSGVYISPVLKAWIYCGLNETDQALSFIEEGVRLNSHRLGLDMHNFGYIFNSISDDPRYKKLLKQMHL